MKIISQLGVRRGEDHETFCEDFAVEFENEKYHYGAILDGCSSGVDSHFASSLFGKIFNQLFRDTVGEGKQLFETPIKEATFIMIEFYQKLKNIKESLNLSLSELHSTIIFSVYDKLRYRKEPQGSWLIIVSIPIIIAIFSFLLMFVF